MMRATDGDSDPDREPSQEAQNPIDRPPVLLDYATPSPASSPRVRAIKVKPSRVMIAVVLAVAAVAGILGQLPLAILLCVFALLLLLISLIGRGFRSQR